MKLRINRHKKQELQLRGREGGKSANGCEGERIGIKHPASVQIKMRQNHSIRVKRIFGHARR